MWARKWSPAWNTAARREAASCPCRSMARRRPRAREIRAGEKQVGTLLSSAGTPALALIRLDRLAEATAPLMAEGVALTVVKPALGRAMTCRARVMSALRHEDGLCRCNWCGTDPLYVAYHDTEWGVPEYDSRALFEKLLLDGFQAGLSWITILRKRDNFRRAFDGFDPEKMARYTPKKREALMQDAGIVRNRLKIEASVTNAQAYLAIPDFSAYLWNFMDGSRCRTGSAA